MVNISLITLLTDSDREGSDSVGCGENRLPQVDINHVMN